QPHWSSHLCSSDLTRSHPKLGKQGDPHEDVPQLRDHVESQNLTGGLLSYCTQHADDHGEAKEQNQDPQPSCIPIKDDRVPAVDSVDAHLSVQARKERGDSWVGVRVRMMQTGVT